MNDSTTTNNRADVYQEANATAGWGLIANVVLAILKLAGGVLTGSVALVADAVNSIGDIASAFAIRGALQVAQREEDEEHPYGHSKAESIAGLSIALLVVFSALALALETARRWGEKTAPPPLLAAIIAGICAVTKEMLYHITTRVADRLQSASLRAIGWDHRSDAMASAAIALALWAAPHLGPLANVIDQIAAILVCGFLVIVGGRLFARTAAELMDQQADRATVEQIRKASQQVNGVSDVEKLRARKSGLEFFVEIHVQVEGHLTVSEGHRIGHAVKDQIMLQMPRVRDVHVHVEPHESP